MNFLIYISMAFAMSTALISHPAKSPLTQNHFVPNKDTLSWQERGIQWLIQSQSTDGGWGLGSHMPQSGQHVNTDPGTTALAARALLKAGGELNSNRYQKEILNALDLILDYLAKSTSGNIVSITSLRLPNMPGMSSQAVIAEFIWEINNQLPDTTLFKIEMDQPGNYVVTLPATKENNPLVIDSSILLPILSPPAMTIADTGGIRNSQAVITGEINGILVQSIDGVELSEVTVVGLRVNRNSHNHTYAISNVSNTSANTRNNQNRQHRVSHVARNIPVVQFSGETYVGYKNTSESLANTNNTEWVKWRNTIEKQFKASQNPNGSWTGYHCFSSPAICTASVLLAWYAGNEKKFPGSVK